MNQVHTRDEAIAAVDRALASWSATATGVLTQAQSAAAVAADSAERVERQCAEEVRIAEGFLAAASAEERPARSSALTRALEAHGQAQRAAARVNDIVKAVAQLSRTQATETVTNIANARSHLTSMSQALERYRNRTGAASETFGGALTVSTASLGTPTALTQLGLVDLDVNTADLDENPILDDNLAGGTFGKGGLRRADYRWAVQTWHDIVGPGVAADMSRQDFEDRDARATAQPLRRTADVYDMFTGTNRIRAEKRPDGSLNIINGRHRLAIARELGIDTLPGELS